MQNVELKYDRDAYDAYEWTSFLNNSLIWKVEVVGAYLWVAWAIPAGCACIACGPFLHAAVPVMVGNCNLTEFHLKNTLTRPGASRRGFFLHSLAIRIS